MTCCEKGKPYELRLGVNKDGDTVYRQWHDKATGDVVSSPSVVAILEASLVSDTNCYNNEFATQIVTDLAAPVFINPIGTKKISIFNSSPATLQVTTNQDEATNGGQTIPPSQGLFIEVQPSSGDLNISTITVISGTYTNEDIIINYLTYE